MKNTDSGVSSFANTCWRRLNTSIGILLIKIICSHNHRITVMGIIIAGNVAFTLEQILCANPDSKVHGSNMGPIWGRQDLGGYLGREITLTLMNNGGWRSLWHSKCGRWLVCWLIRFNRVRDSKGPYTTHPTQLTYHWNIELKNKNTNKEKISLGTENNRKLQVP